MMQLRSYLAKGALGVGLVGLALNVPPVPRAAADVRAFSATTGSADQRFHTLDPSTQVRAVVPDGAHGAYLIGHIVFAGVDRQLAHMLPNGRLDPTFHVTFGGGAVRDAALRTGQLALVGSFSSVDGQSRRHVAIVNARTGLLEQWAPALPAGLTGRRPGQIAFTPTRLVASVAGAVVAWGNGQRASVWSRRSPRLSPQDTLFPPLIATTGSSIWAALNLEQRGAVLASLSPASGDAHVVNPDARWAEWLTTIDGRVFESARGTYARLNPTLLVPSCGNASATTNTTVTTIKGDARTLYVALAPVDADAPGTISAIVACNLSDPSMPALPRFHVPKLAGDGGSIESMALIGTHLLVFQK